MADDSVDHLMRELRRLEPQLKPDVARVLELGLRQTFGGSRLGYVRKDPSAGKACLLAVGLAAGESLREAFAHAGVGRRTGYRLLTRRWR